MPQIVNGQPTGVLLLSADQLQAISDFLHGKRQVRMSAEQTWTALDQMDLLTAVDSELALLRAEQALDTRVLKY